METLYVKMLGSFSIKTKEKSISDKENRSLKMWNLLAYLIYHRHRPVTQKELFDLLWGDGERENRSAGALKTLFYRARCTLDQLWSNAGHELILYQNGGYIWNKECPMSVDVDEFDKWSQLAKGEEGQKNAYRALKIYEGDFLSRMSAEPWVMPVAAYCHNRYMQSLLCILPSLMEQEKNEEAAQLCRTAIEVDPFQEKIYYYFMRALLNMGDQKGAASLYKQLGEKLYDNFGILPSEETSALYYEAVRANQDYALPMDIVIKQLHEEDPAAGAMICEFEFFRVLYRSMARSMERSGLTAHVALLSLTGDGEDGISRRKIDGAMDKLEEQIRISLRKGDVAARCSASQYIVLLQQANYENSIMVCNRIKKAFCQRYPHLEAVVNWEIQPIRPNEIFFK